MICQLLASNPERWRDIVKSFARTSLVSLGCLLVISQVKPLLANEQSISDMLEMEGAVVMIRHAIAPGTGDPESFKLGDCTTQRNLSAAGRAQAVRIGDLFRANGINEARVYSSQWCRCLDTARLMALGPVEELAAINSFFRDFDRQDSQTRQLAEWLGRQNPDKLLLLVTHQVNITAFTGVFPSSGDLVFIKVHSEGEVEVIGTIPTN